jgi:hypothetical protein
LRSAAGVVEDLMLAVWYETARERMVRRERGALIPPVVVSELLGCVADSFALEWIMQGKGCSTSAVSEAAAGWMAVAAHVDWQWERGSSGFETPRTRMRKEPRYMSKVYEIRSAMPGGR